VNPGGDAGWDGTPLDIQVPDDARELERDVLAYHREQRALRRRRRLRKYLPGQAGIMPLMASVLAVCLVAGLMLSVFTITPTDGPGKTHPATTTSATPRPSSAQPASLAPGSATRQSPATGTTGGTTTASTGGTTGSAAPASRTSSSPASGHPRASGAPRAQSTG